MVGFVAVGDSLQPCDVHVRLICGCRGTAGRLVARHNMLEKLGRRWKWHLSECGYPVCRDADSLFVPSCGSSAHRDADSRRVVPGLGDLAMEEAAAWSTEVELGDLYCVLELR